MMKEIFNTYIKQLQDTITSKLEAIDGKATFHQDIWERPEGGGGRTRVIENWKTYLKKEVLTFQQYMGNCHILCNNCLM